MAQLVVTSSRKNEGQLPSPFDCMPSGQRRGITLNIAFLSFAISCPKNAYVSGLVSPIVADVTREQPAVVDLKMEQIARTKERFAEEERDSTVEPE